MKTPGMEEFAERAKDGFARFWPSLSVGEIERFFAEEETKDVIRAHYGEGVKALREGSVTEKIFTEGFCPVSSGAWRCSTDGAPHGTRISLAREGFA